jgi:hypothetical protein
MGKCTYFRVSISIQGLKIEGEVKNNTGKGEMMNGSFIHGNGYCAWGENRIGCFFRRGSEA